MTKTQDTSTDDFSQEWMYAKGVVYAGDYANEGEPDVLIRIEAAQDEDAVGRLIARAPTLLAENEQLRAFAARVAEHRISCGHDESQDCGRCVGLNSLAAEARRLLGGGGV